MEAAIQEAATAAFGPTPAEAERDGSGHGRQGFAAARPNRRTFKQGTGAKKDDVEATKAVFHYIKGGGACLDNTIHVAAARAAMQQMVDEGDVGQCFADEEI